ncbi:protein NRT1/ PTR FAMILY 2.11-like isoform X2 [Quercus lobata]|uniref:protein NRT1/ PTR FAMILY 2.11-like isoform X2 n=1 Tax=Quercus lobata TaxID=97700 RepID=UPI001246DDDF|nr:protein NRT1/ PTR FAMILY 2.11-like isoform X2 [Quercus lobata]
MEQGDMEKNDKAATTDEPQLNYRGIKAMPFVIGNETFEKLGTIGTSTNLLVYLTTVFNMNSITATLLINIFNGTTNFATILGAFLCDTYFGRYNTLGFASVASFLGMLVLCLTAAIAKLHPPHCGTKEIGNCPGPTPWQMAFLLSSLGLLVVGAGGIRPCNLAFGADQFNPNTESGKRGISSFFNCPLASMVQVIVAAVKKRQLKLPEQPWHSLFKHIPPSTINSKVPYTDQFRFLDKAAIITPDDQVKSDGSAANPWRLCSIQQVEQVKCLMRVIPIWVAASIYYVVIVQQQTYVVFQALQFDRRLGNTKFTIPAASYIIFTMLALTIWIPVYDRIIIPILRRLTGKEDGITVLQKMGVGMVLAIITMLVSALVEERRRTLAITKPVGIDPRRGAISSLSGMWLIPQLSLVGLSEAFTLVGEVEFYYKQFPENMRSIGGSFLFVGLALSSYFSSFLVSVIHRTTSGAATGQWLPEDLNKGRLDYFYYLIAAIEVVNLGYFIICAKWYKYKGSDTSVHEVDMGKMQSEKEKPLV